MSLQPLKGPLWHNRTVPTHSPRRGQAESQQVPHLSQTCFSSPAPTLPSPNTADHMGSYGPAFYQSYDSSGQFTHEFDGEQIFSVDLKNREVVWRLPEFGASLYSNFQNGLASIAMIRAHLDILVERSNRTRAISGTWPSLCPT